MNIRRAEEKDIPRIIELLKQVLQIHADIRPDIFISGTTKYTTDELVKMINDDKKPIYVAVNGSDICVGYAFCQLQEQSVSNNTVPFKLLYIDDLCVDKEQRGKHIGKALVLDCMKTARSLGFRILQFNAVVESNASARHLYESLGFHSLGTIPGGFLQSDGAYVNIVPYYISLTE